MKDKKIIYLNNLNKELATELVQYDMMLTKVKVKLNKKQRAFKLLNNLQELIAQTNDTNEFYRNIAEQINLNLDFEATYIYVVDETDPSLFHLDSYNINANFDGKTIKQAKTFFLNEFPELNNFLLINYLSPKTKSIEKLRKKYNLSSLIIYPVYENEKMKLILITGNNTIDDLSIRDLNEDDVQNLEAVSILTSSYERKLKLFELHEIDKIKTEFVSNLSHEFRTPLTLVLGLLDEVSKNKLLHRDEDSRRQLNIVIKNARRLKQLIDQLLDLSKLETKTDKLLVRPNQLKELVNDLINSYSILAQKQGVEFTHSFTGKETQTWFDSDKLEKILSNLLSNALKYCAKSGKVAFHVKIETKPQVAVFRIEDNGPGIADSEKEKIFEKYYRSIHEHDPFKEGSGIGLYLSKMLTELHHGSIELIQNEIGKVFVLKIPLSRNSYLKQEQYNAVQKENKPFLSFPQATVSSFNGQKPHLLLVEDNKELNHFIQSNLEADLKISAAFDGQQGLAKAVNELPDLIISDVMMPRMDGIELCQRLKSNPLTRHIPVILLTAKADYGSKISGLETGADDYITKPFDMNELKLKIKNHIETMREQKRWFYNQLLTTPDKDKLATQKDAFLKEVLQLMQDNLDNPNFGVKDICNKLLISRTQLYRKTEALTGNNPASLLRLLRIKMAAALFEKGHKNVVQVMYQVGFNNPSNFAQKFKSQFGLNPSEYFKKLH